MGTRMNRKSHVPELEKEKPEEASLEERIKKED